MRKTLLIAALIISMIAVGTATVSATRPEEHTPPVQTAPKPEPTPAPTPETKPAPAPVENPTPTAPVVTDIPADTTPMK